MIGSLTNKIQIFQRFKSFSRLKFRFELKCKFQKKKKTENCPFGWILRYFIPAGMRCFWEISNRSPLERDISKTSQKHLKRDVFFETSLIIRLCITHCQNTVKVSYKKLRTSISGKYLIHLSCNNAFFSKLIKKAVIRNFNCQKNTSAGALFLIGIAWNCRLFIKKETLAQVLFWKYWETPILQNGYEGFK